MTGSSRQYHCPQCSYDLRGQSVERCPECGFHYDRSALRSLIWASFYSELIPTIRAGQVFAALGVVLLVVLAVQLLPWGMSGVGARLVVVFLIGAYFAARHVENLILGPFRPRSREKVLEEILARGRKIVLTLVCADLLLFLLLCIVMAH